MPAESLSSKLQELGIVNASSYASSLERDEWDFEGLVALDDDSLTTLLTKHGMKEGSMFKLQQHLREVRRHQTGHAMLGHSGASLASTLHHTTHSLAGGDQLDALVLAVTRGGSVAQGLPVDETDGQVCFAEGCRWLYGFGHGINYREAAVWPKRGAELKSGPAAAHLACLLMAGKGAAAQGAAAARSTELEATMWGMKAVDSFGLQAAADAGDVTAKLALGLLLNAGVGIELNQSLAIQCFRKAAMAGDPVAMNSLAGMIENGAALAVEDMGHTAADWYRKAADAGVVQAQSNYALMLMNGKGVPLNETLAMDYFIRAAEQGDSDVQNWLGLVYQDGKCGVHVDFCEAARWYAAAAEQGDYDAQAWLGMLYKEGKGVPKNDTVALEYFMSAAAGGAEQAIAELRSRGLEA